MEETSKKVRQREIKDYLHLYLGCKFIHNVHKGVFELCGYNSYEAYAQNSLGVSTFDARQIKLILRPLSDMTEEEAVEFIHLKHRSILCNIDRTEIRKVSFGETKNIINFSYFKQRGAGAELGSKTYYVNQSEPEQFIFLLSRSFDLFGLIEAGLAVDKTKGEIKTELI